MHVWHVHHGAQCTCDDRPCSVFVYKRERENERVIWLWSETKSDMRVVVLVWFMHWQSLRCVTNNECGAPELSKYVLTDSRVSFRHLWNLHFRNREPWCFTNSSGWPHSGFGHLSGLSKSCSCVHMGVLLVTKW